MKTILSGIFIISIAVSFTNGGGTAPGEAGKLSGVVTYIDSYISPVQPDGGCEIYAISETDLKSTESRDVKTVVENFQRGKTSHSLALSNTLDPVTINKLQKNFDLHSNFVSKYISDFKNLPGIKLAKTNERGFFALNLKPGKYQVVFVSGSVKSSNAAETSGNIDCRSAVVVSAGESVLSIKFEMRQNRMIMFMAGRQPDGC